MTLHREAWPRIDAPTGPGPQGVSILVSGVAPVLHVDLATGTVTRPVLCAGNIDGVRPVAVPWARVLNVVDAQAAGVEWVDPLDRLHSLAGNEPVGGGTPVTTSGAYAVAGQDGSLLVVTRTSSGQELSRYDNGNAIPSVQPFAEGQLLVGEVAEGLLVRDATAGHLLLIDPSTGRLRADLGTEADLQPAIQGEAVAWFTGSCASRCTLRTDDLSTGRTRDIPVPGTRDPSAVTKDFSPEGTSIALSYKAFGSGKGGAVVVSTVTGKSTHINGMRTSGSGSPLGVTWSADGRWLVLSAANATFGRFAVWNAVTQHLTAMPWVVPLDISQDVLSTVAGPLEAWG